MCKDIVFTRYLYLMDEVEIALVFSLLNKKEEALYWAYELYYSGFEKELWRLLFLVYYKFYATINPTFEMYLIKKRGEFNKKPEDKIIANIVNNFIIRNYNLDVFMLYKYKKYDKNVNLDCNINDINNILKLLKEQNFDILTKLILNAPKDCDEIVFQNILCAVYKYYSGNEISKKILADWSKAISYYNKKVVLLSRIIHYYSLYEKKIIMGKSLYICIDEKELEKYYTLVTNNHAKAYIVLRQEVKYSTNDSGFLNLFALNRNNVTNIKELYFNDWLYYASFSPFWYERIQEFGGKIDNNNKKVLFEDEIMEEEFYNHYNYEPEEQKKEVQDKNIPEINKEVMWKTFYEKYKNNSVLEFEFE